MKKDSQFTLRLPTELREDLQEIADTEGRSLAQVCDAFLRAGSEVYKKQGFKYLQKFLTKKG
jgi:predicted DNA-binding protein